MTTKGKKIDGGGNRKGKREKEERRKKDLNSGAESWTCLGGTLNGAKGMGKMRGSSVERRNEGRKND